MTPIRHEAMRHPIYVDVISHLATSGLGSRR